MKKLIRNIMLVALSAMMLFGLGIPLFANTAEADTNLSV